jgi:hypothetical protein
VTKNNKHSFGGKFCQQSKKLKYVLARFPIYQGVLKKNELKFRKLSLTQIMFEVGHGNFYAKDSIVRLTKRSPPKTPFLRFFHNSLEFSRHILVDILMVF